MRFRFEMMTQEETEVTLTSAWPIKRQTPVAKLEETYSSPRNDLAVHMNCLPQRKKQRNIKVPPVTISGIFRAGRQKRAFLTLTGASKKYYCHSVAYVVLYHDIVKDRCFAPTFIGNCLLRNINFDTAQAGTFTAFIINSQELKPRCNVERVSELLNVMKMISSEAKYAVIKTHKQCK